MRSRVSRRTAVLFLLGAAVLFLTLFPKGTGGAGMQAILLYFRLQERESPSGELWVTSLSGCTWRLADGVRAGEAVWSPAGTKIVYLKRHLLPWPREAGYEHGEYEFWIADPADRSTYMIRKFMSEPGFSGLRNLAWWFDGRIYFGAIVANGAIEVYSIRPDGSDLRSEDFYYAYAFWLHPGGLISGLDRYFSAALYDRTAKRLVELPQGFYELETLSFSPSGRKAVARRGSEAVLFDFETGEERVLFPCEVAAQWYWPPGKEISWSPDERYLAVAASWDGDEEIYIFDLDSCEKIPLTENDCQDLFPVWSPDGKFLAYMSDEGWRGCLRVFSLETGGDSIVICSQGFLAYPRWRPSTTP